MRSWLATAVSFTVVLTACSEPASRVDDEEVSEEPTPCAIEDVVAEDGTCLPPGIGSDGCGEGFVHDGDVGCSPLLPPGPCPAGMMAVPGDEACREVAPCGDGPWGDIPVEANTQHVDIAYGGIDSDGSPERPWTTIEAATAVAEPGAIVAIAEGTYAEGFLVTNKPIRLWGRCPSMVAITGDGGPFAAVEITHSAGNEIRGVSISNAAGPALLLSGVSQTLVESVRLHGAIYGLRVTTGLGPAEVTVRGSLVEGNVDSGLFIDGAHVVAEGLHIRDNLPTPDGIHGRGIDVLPDMVTDVPGSLILRGCHLSGNAELGLSMFGVPVLVEDTAIVDTVPNALGLGGRGINAQIDINTGAPASLDMRRSVVARSREVGVWIYGSSAIIDQTVVRDTAPLADSGGHGITISYAPGGVVGSSLALWRSLVERTSETGVAVLGGDAAITSVVVRDVGPTTRTGGRGVNVQRNADDDFPGNLVLQSSRIERTDELGVFVADASAELWSVHVQDIGPSNHVSQGQGVAVVGIDPSETPIAQLTITRSLVERSHQVGVQVYDASAIIDDCTISGVKATPDGLYGDGIAVIGEIVPTTATVTNTRVLDSARAGASAYGAALSLAGSELICQAFDLNGETYLGQPHDVVDAGGNACGCPEPDAACKLVSAELEPPSPAEEAEPP